MGHQSICNNISLKQYKYVFLSRILYTWYFLNRILEALAQKLDPLIKKEAMEEAHAQHWLVCCVSRDFIFDTFCEWSELGQEFIR